MTRRLVAGVAAFLLALHAVAFVRAAAARAGETQSASIFETRCADARDGAPITHHAADDHCFQCASREGPGPAAEPAAATVFVPVGVLEPVGPPEAYSPRAPPLGWGSSWSSRAPPPRS